jgi:UPF0716 protein FxsA
MAGLLLVLFVVVPLVELYVIVSVAHVLGVLPTLAVLVLVSVLGAWLVKREGLGLLRRMQATLGRGEVPTAEVVDGGLLLVAGALCLVPGFVTDAVGLLLVLGPVRAFVRNRLIARWSRGGGLMAPGRSFLRTRVVDVEYVGDVTPPRRPPASPPTELGSGR